MKIKINKPFWQDFIQSSPWPIVRNPFVIAELGINHNGDLDIAKKLIDVAVESGCDAVKFQKRTPELCVPPHQQSVLRDTPWGLITYLEYRHKIEFGLKEFTEISKYCKKKKITWFGSAWDLPSLKFLERFKVPYHKVPSAMLVHTELLKGIAATKKLTFISGGMSTYQEIEKALAIFKKANCPVILMHAVSEYPADNKVLNLRQIVTLRQKYNVPIAYSGHETSITPSVLAATLGAVAIERHLTLDRNMWGTDQKSSLDPEDLTQLVYMLREQTKMLGTGVRVITSKEKENAKKLRYFKKVKTS